MDVELDDVGTRSEGGLHRGQGVFQELVGWRQDALCRAGVALKSFAREQLVHAAMGDQLHATFRRGNAPRGVPEVDRGDENAEADQYSTKHPRPRKSRTIGGVVGRNATARGLSGRAISRGRGCLRGIVLQFDEAERLQHRRHIVAEAAAEAFLEPVPAAHRVVGRTGPGFDRAVFGRLLLVGVAKVHPVAVLFQHRVEVLDGPQVIAELGTASDADERWRVRRRVAIDDQIARPRWCFQLPRVVFRTLALNRHPVLLSSLPTYP